MWTIDTRCASCSLKTTCSNRPKMLLELSTLTNILNTAPEYQQESADGIIVMACQTYTQG